MRIIRQIEELVQGLPLWGAILLGLLLVAFSAISVYGRINTAFGAKVFSRIPPEELRSNIPHILSYTVLPLLVTAYFLFLRLSG